MSCEESDEEEGHHFMHYKCLYGRVNFSRRGKRSWTRPLPKTKRTLALGSVKKWDIKIKGKLAEIPLEEFMSCQESDEEDGSPVYAIKSLA